MANGLNEQVTLRLAVVHRQAKRDPIFAVAKIQDVIEQHIVIRVAPVLLAIRMVFQLVVEPVFDRDDCASVSLKNAS